MRRALLPTLLLALALASSATAAGGLHVSGNQLQSGDGHQFILRGVNRSGSEYSCVQGRGFFDGPSSDRSVRAISSWHVNFVRVLLNEDCWLGINGVKRKYSGTAYREAIQRYVRLLHRHGMYVELSLIWGAPGRHLATAQPAAPDEDHSPAMWRSMAKTFKRDHHVILAPWGEPVVSADCLLHGGFCQATWGKGSKRKHYRTAGMQQAVRVMRRAGYRGPIAIPGLSYANDMRQWLSHEPNDPLHQLIAEAHVYGKNLCSSVSCFDESMAPVAAQVPLIFGETGETYDSSDCGSSNIAIFLQWADAHNVGYATWTWDAWGTCNSLIKNYGGKAAHVYGRFVHDYLATNAPSTHRLGGRT
ncbi:MAG: cellulase family glycosylhydrolase [Solirubrobacterales bacterium]|nr:cellulase family glycosylhydrolase [Solirubrobacterales bacterium]